MNSATVQGNLFNICLVLQVESLRGCWFRAAAAGRAQAAAFLLLPGSWGQLCWCGGAGEHPGEQPVLCGSESRLGRQQRQTRLELR